MIAVFIILIYTNTRQIRLHKSEVRKEQTNLAYRPKIIITYAKILF